MIATSIFEYDKEEEEKKLRKAEYEAGREAGIKLGREVGIKETTNHLKCLYEKLKQDGREDEFLRAMTDPDFLKSLYREYEIEND